MYPMQYNVIHIHVYMYHFYVVNHHVNMKEVVVKQIESLLYRPNLTEKAQLANVHVLLVLCTVAVLFRYYAICFLNQIVIAPADQRLALKLSSVYFSFFKVHVCYNPLQ